MRRELTLLLWVAACGEPSVDLPDAGPAASDAQGSAPPAAPLVDPAPARTPYAVATLHGSARAKRVIVEGGGNPVATSVLPDGSFCVDVPLPTAAVYRFTLFAQSADGQLSAPVGPVELERTPQAPVVPGAQTCSGADPAGCPMATENCSNGRDDDCDSLIDGNDPACATCQDDALEPNDDPLAPRLDPGRFDARICPANEDYYGVFVRAAETVEARIFFSHAEGNLDLALLGLDHRTVLARSSSLDDDEALTHTATATGEYKLRVHGDSGAAARYVLDLAVR